METTPMNVSMVVRKRAFTSGLLSHRAMPPSLCSSRCAAEKEWESPVYASRSGFGESRDGRLPLRAAQDGGPS